MSRFFLSPDAWLDGDLPSHLTGDEARHLSQVLRLQAGALVTVFDGNGRRAIARVLEVTRDRVSLQPGPPLPRRPVLPAITLAQAIPKGKSMDLIVQKAVELGVASIHPLVTCHTIVQPAERKSEKWRRTALEACKQCGQDLLPDIPDPLPFERWLDALHDDPAGGAGLRLIASLDRAAQPVRNVLRQHPGTIRCTVIVGPEGDFSSNETSAALAAGFIPVSLGEIILRVETAAIFCLSALRYEFGCEDLVRATGRP